MKNSAQLHFKHTSHGGILDQAIALLIKKWTGGKYFHCEIMVKGVSYNCSPDGPTGISVDTSLPINDTHWDTINLPGLDTDLLDEWLVSKVGSKYDWFGLVMSQILPLKNDDPSRWFCSELCVRGLQLINVLDGNIKPSTIGPNELFCLVQAKPSGEMVSDDRGLTSHYVEIYNSFIDSVEDLLEHGIKDTLSRSRWSRLKQYAVGLFN